jgi:hypothetical protein
VLYSWKEILETVVLPPARPLAAVPAKASGLTLPCQWAWVMAAVCQDSPGVATAIEGKWLMKMRGVRQICEVSDAGYRCMFVSDVLSGITGADDLVQLSDVGKAIAFSNADVLIFT